MAGEEERSVSTYETYISQPNERTVLLVRNNNNTWQNKLGLYEAKDLNFWRTLLGEFVLALLFTLLACASTLTLDAHSHPELHHALSIGFAVAILIAISVEGSGLFNPAISFGMLVARKIKLVRFLLLVAVQITGSLAGAGLLYVYTPRSVRGALGAVSLNSGVSSGTGFVIEMTLTFVHIWVVCAAFDPENGMVGFQAPLVIGMSTSVMLMAAAPYTGAICNPIRAFGPGVITSNLSDHWVYWIGPLVGAFLAAVCYEFVFKLSKKEPVKGRNDMPTVQLHINPSSSSSV